MKYPEGCEVILTYKEWFEAGVICDKKIFAKTLLKEKLRSRRLAIMLIDFMKDKSVRLSKINSTKNPDTRLLFDDLPSVADDVSDEVIDMFVERIIYRGVVDGNDEFVWVMNLSGECTDTSAKYKIRGYDKDYADSLKSDKNFNIVARMLIPMEECKRFCQEEAGRRFKKKYWNPITIKIAIA